MSKQTDLLQLIQPSLLGKWIAERLDIWQMDLLDEEKLARFAKDRGLGSFSAKSVRQLWQLKLLRADLVVSHHKLRLAGLIEVGIDQQDGYMYADERLPRRRRDGWGNAAVKLKPFPSGVKLFLHPFRYYVLYHLDRVLQLSFSAMQMLVFMEGYSKLLERELSELNAWSASPGFLQSVNEWNSIAALAIATEPCVYTRIIGTFRKPHSIDVETQEKRILKHWAEVANCYRAIGTDQIEKMRQDLWFSAESLDPNGNVHMILRLMRGKERLKLKGKLGGAVFLHTMSEVLRRATEEACNVKLPEEHGFGYGELSRIIKQEGYGSERILDGKRITAKQFLRDFGLDYGVRLRCYVEGPTDYGALNSVLKGYTAIQLINLKGEVWAGRGKGLTFEKNLELDWSGNIFSFILLDKDNSDNVKVVRQAARNDKICGRFFLSDPDIEFENFTLLELEEILWSMAIEYGASHSARQALHSAISGGTSGNQLENAVKNAPPELFLNQFHKGEEWGERLMSFAWNNREIIIDEATKQTKTRGIVEVAEKALFNALAADYYLTRIHFKVNPEDGRLIKRDTQESDRGSLPE